MTVYVKWTRTKSIIFFFWSGPEEPREPNYTNEHTPKIIQLFGAISLFTFGKYRF